MARIKGKFAIDEIFTHAAVDDLITVINDCGGNEVFCVGRLDQDLRVSEVEPLAFGADSEVPAILGVAHPGDVVIHNHPSGELSPSAADSHLASILAQENIGSCIVNNAVDRVYVIFRPIPLREYSLLDANDITQYFTQSGLLSRVQNDFEFRPQQVAMSSAIARAFNENKIAIIEAGTGVGKSFAYLIPAIRWAIANKERVLISTFTINLQEQLINKDIPVLRDNLKLAFSSVLAKGRNNYICLRKIDMYGRELNLFESKAHEKEAKEIIKWAHKTEDGTLSELNIKPNNDVWEQFVSEPDNCIRLKCTHYEKCFFHRARREAAHADIIVANHHLVMADIALRSSTQNYDSAAVLPPFKRLIFDEAQHLEDVATSYFGFQVTHFGINRLLARLCSRRKTERGILHVLYRTLFDLQQDVSLETFKNTLDTLSNVIIPARYRLQDDILEAMETIRKDVRQYAYDAGIAESEKDSIKIRITSSVRKNPIWTETLLPNLSACSGLIGKFASQVRTLVSDVEAIKSKNKSKILELTLDIKTRIRRLQEICSKLNIFSTENEELCFWVELAGKRKSFRDDGPLRFCMAPINVGDSLRDSIFSKINTVGMTSATLTVDNSFDYFMNRTGIADVSHESDQNPPPPIPTERLMLLKLDTPFHFEQQAFVGIPLKFPEPSDLQYPDQLETFITEAVRISRGSALILFTSYRMLRHMFDRLSPIITAMGYECMQQGDAPRHKLLSRFREDIHSVLFATASFWEGIDVKGEALRCLILARLPFRVPTEPIMEARAEYLQAHGADPFYELDLPWAVMRFRQGFGRLIRSRSDTGAILITDGRIISRSYGRKFLRSLPPVTTTIAESPELLNQLAHFFEKSR